MIEYTHVSDKPFAIRVTLDKKMQGFIRQEDDGKGYYFARKDTRGEQFQTIAEVKRSLES